jgi:hypothetical protein
MAIVGGDLVGFEGLIGKGVFQNFIARCSVRDRGCVAHELRNHVLENGRGRVMRRENLVEPFDLFVGLPDVLAKTLRHLGVLLDALNLALHDLKRFFFDGMDIAKANDIDRLHLIGGVRSHIRRKAVPTRHPGSIS